MNIFSRSKVWIFILLLSLMPFGCTKANEENGSETEILSTVLFQPDDLDDGWYANTYQQFLQTTDFDPAIPSTKAIGAFIQAEPGSVGERGKYYQFQPSEYSAGQSLFEYQDETKAGMAAENLRQLLAADQYGIKPFNIVHASQLEIINAGCRLTEGPGIGLFDNCFFIIQHGRYISRASMAVDGELITIKDWEDFINAIQTRLIEQVAKEQNS